MAYDFQENNKVAIVIMIKGGAELAYVCNCLSVEDAAAYQTSLGSAAWAALASDGLREQAATGVDLSPDLDRAITRETVAGLAYMVTKVHQLADGLVVFSGGGLHAQSCWG